MNENVNVNQVHRVNKFMHLLNEMGGEEKFQFCRPSPSPRFSGIG